MTRYRTTGTVHYKIDFAHECHVCCPVKGSLEYSMLGLIRICTCCNEYINFIVKKIHHFNVKWRGNQNYVNEILMGASGHELQTVDRMSTILLSRYLLISKRENRQLGNVVLNSFHFYKIGGKSSCQLLICFLV